MAREAKVSKSTVQRVWSHNEIKPHRLETFKVSNDPNFEEKRYCQKLCIGGGRILVKMTG